MRCLVAIAVLGCALTGCPTKANTGSPRLFKSTWALKVWGIDPSKVGPDWALKVWDIDPSKVGPEGKSPTLLGTTPTPEGQGVSIPAHVTWYVAPVTPAAIDDVAFGILAPELLEQKVPGLDLTRCLITDAGLAHLKGLSALTTLDLGGTKVTDSGVEVLRSARPGLRISD